MYKLPWHWDFPKLLGVARKADERRRFARQIPRGSQYKIKRLKSNSATNCNRKFHGSAHRKNSITKARKNQFKQSELCNIKAWSPIPLLPNVSTTKSQFPNHSFDRNFICNDFHNSATSRAKSTKIKDLERELNKFFLKPESDNDDAVPKYVEEDDDPRKKKKRRLDLYSKPLEYLPNTHLPEVTTRNFSPVRTKFKSEIGIRGHLEENVTSEKFHLDNKSYNIQQNISQTENHDTSTNLTSHDISTRSTLHVEENKPVLNIAKLEPKLDEEKSKFDVDEKNYFFDKAKKGPELAPDTILDVPWKSKTGKRGLKELKEELKTSFLKPEDGEEKLHKNHEDPHNNLENQLTDYPKPTPGQPIPAQPSRVLSDQSYLARYLKNLGTDYVGSNINTKKQSSQTEQNETTRSLPAQESKLEESNIKSNPTVTKSQSDSKIHSSSILSQSLKNIPQFFYGTKPDATKPESEIPQSKSKKTESQPALSDRKWYEIEKSTILGYIKDKLWFWPRSKRLEEKTQTPLLGPGPTRQEKENDIDTIQEVSKNAKSETQILSSAQKNKLPASLNSSLPTPVSRIDISLSSSVPAPESRTTDKNSSVSSESSSLKSPLPVSEYLTSHDTQPVIPSSFRPSKKTFDTQGSIGNSPVSLNSYNTQPVTVNSSTSVPQTSFDNQPVTSEHPPQSHVSQTTYNTQLALNQYPQQWQHMDVLQPHQNNQNMYYGQSGFQSTSNQPYYSQNFAPTGNPTMTVPQATWNTSEPWNSSVINHNIQAGAWQHGQSSYYPAYENQFHNQNITANKSLPTLTSPTSHIVLQTKNPHFYGSENRTVPASANFQHLKHTIDTFKRFSSVKEYLNKPTIPQAQNLARHTPAVQYAQSNSEVQLNREPTLGNHGGQAFKPFGSTSLPSVSVSPSSTLAQSSTNPNTVPYSSAPTIKLPKTPKEPSSMPFPPASTLGLPAYSETNAYSVPVNPAFNLGSPPASNPYNVPLQSVPFPKQLNASAKNALDMPPQPIATPAEPPKPYSPMSYNISPSAMPVPPPSGNVCDNNVSSVPLPFPFPMSLPVINYYSAPFPPGSTPGSFTPNQTPVPFTSSNQATGSFTTPYQTSGSFPSYMTPGPYTSPSFGSFAPTSPPGSTPTSGAFTSTPRSGSFTPVTSGQFTHTPSSGQFAPTPSAAAFTTTPISGSFTQTSFTQTQTPAFGSFTPNPTPWSFIPSSGGTFTPYPQANSFSAPGSTSNLSVDSNNYADGSNYRKSKF